MFNRKADVFNAVLIVSLTVLAVVQVHGLVMKTGATPTPEQAPPQYTVERAPGIRPEPPPPRMPGRSAIRVARAHMLDAIN